MPDGYINRMALGRYIYLETFVKNNQDSAEKNPISFFIAKKLEEAKSKSKKQEAKWFLLDSKTRCKYVVENNISYIECLSCFKANDFEERFAKKEIESFKTAFGIEEFEGEFEGLENPQI